MAAALMPYSDEMTFVQRTLNFLSICASLVFRDLVFFKPFLDDAPETFPRVRSTTVEVSQASSSTSGIVLCRSFSTASRSPLLMQSRSSSSHGSSGTTFVSQ